MYNSEICKSPKTKKSQKSEIFLKNINACQPIAPRISLTADAVLLPKTKNRENRTSAAENGRMLLILLQQSVKVYLSLKQLSLNLPF